MQKSMRTIFIHCVFLIGCFLVSVENCAAEQWNFQKISETRKLTDRPLYIFTSGDLKKDGKKELLVADSGEWYAFDKYNFFILEWVAGELKEKFHKQWKEEDFDAGAEYARGTYYIFFWDSGGKTIAETFPAFFKVEWMDNNYHFVEQKDRRMRIGSWVFPWQSPSCEYYFAKDKWPEECFYGIRKWGSKGELKILSLYSEEKNGRHILRIRKNEPGFPIEFEDKSPEHNFIYRYNLGDIGFGRFGEKSHNQILFKRFEDDYFYAVSYDIQSAKYNVLKTGFKELGIIPAYGVKDIYIGSTRERGKEEYWGGRKGEALDGGTLYLLRRAEVKSDLSAVIGEDITFPHHKMFIGVGYLDVQDVDGDGLDELILLEETGKRHFSEEYVTYSQTLDYIKILKWNGKKYEVMWESPAYTKRGTRFLVEDLKGTGKKQLIVFTSEGTVQIWEPK